jgi:wyosine [tRNA(Phe)-imidazoG37] synthetase (radical SAM superfamily)
MNYVYGPVPSRRLGLSLGIDPTPLPGPFPTNGRPAKKICNWNCVYCQLGRTRSFTIARSSLFPVESMLAELRLALAAEKAEDIDWITFVGSGEPTLNKDLGLMIRSVKAITTIPVAVITNGSMLPVPKVRNELMAADAVLPTLDAGTPELYARINRPHPNFRFDRHVRGLVSFREQYRGKLCVELMLLAGINDDEASLTDIAAVMTKINPDQIHLVLPTRPPTETWVYPADDEGLLRARAILGTVAKLVYPAQVEFERGAIEDPLEAAAAIIARHPMSNEELQDALSRWGVDDPATAIRIFAESGRCVRVERYGKTFWRAP